MVRTQPFHGCNDRFKSGADLQKYWDIAKRLRHRPLTPAPWFKSNYPSHDTVLKRFKRAACKTVIRRFESDPYLHLVPSSNWLGRKPLKLVMLGSSPAGITIIQGYSLTGRAAVSKTARGCSSRPIPAILLGCRQAVKAPVSDTGICWFESNHPSHTWRVNPEGLGTAR